MEKNRKPFLMIGTVCVAHVPEFVGVPAEPPCLCELEPPRPVVRLPLLPLSVPFCFPFCFPFLGAEVDGDEDDGVLWGALALATEDVDVLDLVPLLRMMMNIPLCSEILVCYTRTKGCAKH